MTYRVEIRVSEDRPGTRIDTRKYCEIMSCMTTGETQLDAIAEGLKAFGVHVDAITPAAKGKKK